jgi:aryl-alcohol dehydrogenase-like predicted oxidoreductase
MGFGCVGLTTLASPARALRLLHAVHEAGIGHFDTAPGYGRGYSEVLLGRFLAETRTPVTVTTKFGLGLPSLPWLPAALALGLNALKQRPRAGPEVRPPESDHVPLLTFRSISRPEIELAFNRSRRALGVERIDCYLLHEGLPSFLDPAAWAYLLELRTAGAIGVLGLAAGGRNYHALTPEELSGWDVLQYEYGPAWPENTALRDRFPRQRHFFHSCLRDHARHGDPGRILADCVQANPGGRVLFSTTDAAHLRANLRGVTDA